MIDNPSPLRGAPFAQGSCTIDVHGTWLLAYPMVYRQANIGSTIAITHEIYYSYFMKSENGNCRHECGKPHHFIIKDTIPEYELFDMWKDQYQDKVFYSSAFTNVFYSRNRDKKPISPNLGSVVMRVSAPLVKPDEVLAITGDNEGLGNWNPQKALLLNCYNFPEWEVVLDKKIVNMPFNYKFLTLKKGVKKNVVSWDSCDNRHFSMNVPNHSVVYLNDLLYKDTQPVWRGAGTAIPVFSLRSEEDFGVGDFYDLFKMVDWAKETGQRVIQLLPINDTTMTHTRADSYPYKTNSTFALHPIYLRPDKIGVLSNKQKLAYYKAVAKELNSLDTVDYERVNKEKLAYLHDIYDEVGTKTIKGISFRNFMKNNSYWLKPYAVFCVLRDKFNTADFKEWGEYQNYNDTLIDCFCKEHDNEVNFIYFLQYHLDKQLREVRNYAHNNGVILKGDIPIGIARTSVDAWIYPHLFYMDCQAGAPPDDFSVLGQNWGFPTYNWEEMSKDGFLWWKNRFRKMSEYFDAYRIDHILGFFRIWQMPMNAVYGLLGTFNPAMPYSAETMRNNYDFWINHDVQTKPYIVDYLLEDLFGEFVSEVKGIYMERLTDGRYQLKEFIDSQRKIENYFGQLPLNDKNTTIKNALMELMCDVLFIEDDKQERHYHPRISAQKTYSYRSLNDYERWCFDRLYYDFFYHRHNDFWYQKAMWKLPPLINATDMLVCGEDLGMIPECVDSVMSEQQILSLEIQRMPKDSNHEFGIPDDYPYLSVCTTSTHDMSGIRAWWEEDYDKTQRFFNNVLCEKGEAPNYATPYICEKIVKAHLHSPAILTILPLQDWLSINSELRRNNPQEEQINIPANPFHYWRYRMHLTLEKLLLEKDFNRSIKEQIENSGR